MPASNRLILAAFAGLAALFVAFGLGLMLGASDPEEQRYQPYSHPSKQPTPVNATSAGQSSTEPLRYHTPCKDPKGETESDLCAQWRAAHAGEDSAFWAKWGFWIATIGSVFLLWQIMLTRKAVEETGDATDAMKRSNNIAEQQQRPWLDIAIDYDPTKIYYGEDDVRAIINVIATNHGERPCIVMNVDFRLVVNDMAGYKFKRSIPETVLHFATNIDIKPEYLDLIIHKKEQRYEGICDLVTESSSFIWLSAVVRVLYRDPATSKIHFTIRTFTFDSPEWNYNSPYIKMMSAESGSLPVEGAVIYPQGSYAT